MKQTEIHSFSQQGSSMSEDRADTTIFGERGVFLMQLSKLGLPIAPGFLFDSYAFNNISASDLKDNIKYGVEHIEQNCGKTLSRGKMPLTLKVCLSPSIRLDSFRSIHNVGLNNATVRQLAEITGEDFAYGEYEYLLHSLAVNILEIPLSEIKSVVKGRKNKKDICSALYDLMGAELLSDPYEQLEKIILKYHELYYDDQLNHDIPCAIFVQMMAYGNFGVNSYNGDFNTRNITTGEKVIQGFFGSNEMFTDTDTGNDIRTIDDEHFKDLSNISQVVEDQFLDIKNIRFAIENNKLWLVSVFAVDSKTTKAEIEMLLDLFNRKIIDEKYLISKINPNQMHDLLHRALNEKSKKSLKNMICGITGSPGACVGRVFFNTKRFLDAHQDAIVKGDDTRQILAMPSTYAGDVQAIEIGQGVISSEGGYASHAPVVARSLGKVALIEPEIEFYEKSMKIKGQLIEEGEYISMEVSHLSDPIIYFGKADLDPPNLEDDTIFKFVEIINKFTQGFQVRANADTGRDAKMAKKMGAMGIGLCRTEHMFFEKDRINKFRQLLISDETNIDGVQTILGSLKKYQISDFEDLFSVMSAMPVTIRLLDAPLHEFIPHTLEERDQFIEDYQKSGGKLNPLEIKAKFDRLKEINPMLGHRGCRVAISNFDIYKMQISAIFEAALNSHAAGKNPVPEIMIPMVMSVQEIKHIIYGKDIQEDFISGIKGVEKEILDKHKIQEFPFSYKIGSMIELPAAALIAGELAENVEFLSFGTNDLTQTTHGLSRDDINSFLPSYTKFDIINENPFQILTDPVKTLVSYSSIKSRLHRPDIKLGLCGEHGADEKNIKFCIDNNLNYVSCSPYGVPIALLSVARHFALEN